MSQVSDGEEFFDLSHVEVMDWPAYSPDLTAIENLWAILKRKLHTDTFNKVQELNNKIESLWTTSYDLIGICQNLVTSMQDCVVAVINS